LIDNVDASTLVLTAVANNDLLLLEAVDTEVEVLASPTVLEDVVFALEKNSTKPSSQVKLGAGLVSWAPIGVSTDCGVIVGLVESATIEVQVSTEVSTEVKLDLAWSGTGHGNGKEFTASPLRVIIYPPPHQKRPPILITVDKRNSAGQYKTRQQSCFTYHLHVLTHTTCTLAQETSPPQRALSRRLECEIMG